MSAPPALPADFHPQLWFMMDQLQRALAEKTLDFLRLCQEEDGTSLLRELWSDGVMEGESPQSHRSDEGLSLDLQRQEPYFCMAITFPLPQRPPEPYYAVAVIGPSPDWEEETRTILPHRLFLLESRGGDDAEVVEWAGRNGRIAQWQMPVCSPPEFVTTVLAQYGGFTEER